MKHNTTYTLNTKRETEKTALAKRTIDTQNDLVRLLRPLARQRSADYLYFYSCTICLLLTLFLHCHY